MKKILFSLFLFIICSATAHPYITAEEASTISLFHQWGVLSKNRSVPELMMPLSAKDVFSFGIKLHKLSEIQNDELYNEIEYKFSDTIEGINSIQNEFDREIYSLEKKNDQLHNQIKELEEEHNDFKAIAIFGWIVSIAVAILN